MRNKANELFDDYDQVQSTHSSHNSKQNTIANLKTGTAMFFNAMTKHNSLRCGRFFIYLSLPDINELRSRKKIATSDLGQVRKKGKFQ